MLVNHEIDMLEKISLFSDLTAMELKNIRDKMFIRRFKKNEIILSEEDTNKFMYIILRGRVKVDTDPGGQKKSFSVSMKWAICSEKFL